MAIRSPVKITAALIGAALLAACAYQPNSRQAGQAGPVFIPAGGVDPAAAAAAQSGCEEAWDAHHGGGRHRHMRQPYSDRAQAGGGARYWSPHSGKYRSRADQFDRVQAMHGSKHGVHQCVFKDLNTVIQED